jgi:hypothetical protein
MHEQKWNGKVVKGQQSKHADEAMSKNIALLPSLTIRDYSPNEGAECRQVLQMLR